MGPTWGPTDQGTVGEGDGKRHLGWAVIKFGVNSMPLTPSSVAQKFDNFMLKRESGPRSNGLVHSHCIIEDSMVYEVD